MDFLRRLSYRGGSSSANEEEEKPKVVHTKKTRTDGSGCALELESKVNYSTAPAGVESEIVVLASLVAVEQDSATVRNPVDLSIVLDRSGSMAGEKIELCKKTLAFLVEKGLTEQDFLSLVTFDTNVYVAFAGGKMTPENKKLLLESIIPSITSGSSTNLSDGLFKGLDLLYSSSTAEVSAICLLTDGQMNAGVTDKAALVEMTTSKIAKFKSAGKAKPSVFTFGYGSDADTEILKQLSESTGGNFYTILNPESVPISFADCLGGLTAVAAQNVELTLEVAGGGAEFACDPLTKFPFEKLSSTAYRVKIKDLYCGEHRDLLFKLRLPKTKSIDDVTKIHLTCKFTDVIYETFQTITSDIEVARYEGSEKQTVAADAEVTRQLLRIDAAKAMEEARAAGLRGDHDAGRRQMQAALRHTEDVMTALHLSVESDLMMAEVVSDLKVAEENLRSTEAFRSKGEQYMASATMSHGYQRSNKVDSMMDSGMEERSAYANTQKKAMMKMSKAAFGFN